jgi:ribonuclease Z
MQGVSWNLVDGAAGEVHVTELAGQTLATSRYLACEGFAEEHPLDEQTFDGVAYRGREFFVEARTMSHGICSMAYVVRESDRSNVDMRMLAAGGFVPGPWLKQLKDPSIPDEAQVELAGKRLELRDLRDRLLQHRPGESIAYLTDFCLESELDEDELVDFLRDCKVLICENNFRDADAELAKSSYHMTSAEVGRLAARVQPEQLVVFHVSDRYTVGQWTEQLADVRKQFERAVFPPGWTQLEGA